jgi:hypothetical protein
MSVCHTTWVLVAASVAGRWKETSSAEECGEAFYWRGARHVALVAAPACDILIYPSPSLKGTMDVCYRLQP